MDDFDFTKPENLSAPAADTSPLFKPASSKFYDAVVAARFFKLGGREEQFAAGTTIFAENEKSSRPGLTGLFGKRVSHRMYFLTTGEVALTAYGKPIDMIGANEIFGEMAVIGDSPLAPALPTARSATAVARRDCTSYSLDVDEFQAALRQMPDFALMLMSVLCDRLRFVGARLAMRKQAALASPGHQALSLEAPALKYLMADLQQTTTVRYAPGKTIMREGEAGAVMYIVLEGQVAINMGGKLIETVGLGGMFGEMAVVDQSPRTATAQADTECVLLALSRNLLIEQVKNNPSFAVALLKAIADRLRYMNGLLS